MIQRRDVDATPTFLEFELLLNVVVGIHFPRPIFHFPLEGRWFDIGHFSKTHIYFFNFIHS